MTEPTNLEIYKALSELKEELVQRDDKLEDKIDRTYLKIQVFQAEIEPLKKFVFGLISIAGAALITALIGLLIVK
jgi:cob(I)alamin adenosyltransferase